MTRAILFFILSVTLMQGALLASSGPDFFKEAPKNRVYLPAAERWDSIVIHHSATASGNAKIIDRNHRREGFEHGLGYHFIVNNGTAGQEVGHIETGKRWWIQIHGAHCNAEGLNARGIGISLIGNFNHEEVDEKQYLALLWLVKNLQWRYGISSNHVLAHRDVKGKDTDCPGLQFPWERFQQDLNNFDTKRQKRH